MAFFLRGSTVLLVGVGKRDFGRRGFLRDCVATTVRSKTYQNENREINPAKFSANVERTGKSHLLNMFNPGRIARLSAIATTLAVLSAHQAFAGADDKNQQILPFQTITRSTIPSNGDVNPYGVAFVPPDFPAGGVLNPGDLLVSNFNDNQNIQGTGTTIIKVTPNGQTSLFFHGTAPLGLSTGLAVLKAGFVLVANCPTNNTPLVPGALPGSLLLIDKNGNLAAPPLVNPFIQGPWDFTVQDEGTNVKVFISNVVNGTVSRLDLSFNGGTAVVINAAVIASNYTHRVDPQPLKWVQPGWPTIHSETSCTLHQPETTKSSLSGMPVRERVPKVRDA
jgi:hypothetical protein